MIDSEELTAVKLHSLLSPVGNPDNFLLHSSLISSFFFSILINLFSLHLFLFHFAFWNLLVSFIALVNELYVIGYFF